MLLAYCIDVRVTVTDIVIYSTTILQAMRKQRLAALLVIPLIITQFAIGILVIPIWGAFGAVIATFISEWGLLVVHMIIINRFISVRSFVRGTSLLIIPIIIMSIVVLILEKYHVLIPVALSTVVYIFILLKYHPFTNGEIKWLNTILDAHIQKSAD